MLTDQKGIIYKINVLNLNTSAPKRFFIPVSGKASTNIIVSSPLKPDKKHIRGSDLSICNARHKMLNTYVTIHSCILLLQKREAL